MKKVLLFFCLICAGTFFAQETTGNKAYIEVTGTAEMEVVPDEIYVQITLKERLEGKEKLSIEKQEADLRKAVKEIGIELSNLSIQEAIVDYATVRKKNKDVLISKRYLLKLATSAQLSKMYERLDQLNAEDAAIVKYGYSKIVELQKENRIKAIKLAKEKAEYTLAAITQKCGSAVYIAESENYIEGEYPLPSNGMDKMRMMVSNAVARGGSEPETEEGIAFKKIKVRSAFIVRFEIQK